MLTSIRAPSPVRAAQLSDFAVGVGKRGQLLLHRETDDPRSREWLRLLAHELSHVSQIELAQGEGLAVLVHLDLLVLLDGLAILGQYECTANTRGEGLEVEDVAERAFHRGAHAPQDEGVGGLRNGLAAVGARIRM